MINLQHPCNCRSRVFEIRTFVVGSQFYGRDLLRDELLRVIREPLNPANRMAIRVADVRGDTVGYLPPRLSKLLALLIDRGLSQVVARVSASPHPGVAKAFTLRIVRLRILPPAFTEPVVDNLPRRPLAESSDRTKLVSSIPKITG